jgi:hypothetical protein
MPLQINDYKSTLSSIKCSIIWGTFKGFKGFSGLQGNVDNNRVFNT